MLLVNRDWYCGWVELGVMWLDISVVSWLSLAICGWGLVLWVELVVSWYRFVQSGWSLLYVGRDLCRVSEYWCCWWIEIGVVGWWNLA